MGTVITVDLYGTEDLDPAALGAAIFAAARRLIEVDRRFSTWKPWSDVSRLRAGQLLLADVSAELASVLERCALARELTGGAFEPWRLPGGVDPTGLIKGYAAAEALSCLMLRPDRSWSATDAFPFGAEVDCAGGPSST